MAGPRRVVMTHQAAREMALHRFAMVAMVFVLILALFAIVISSVARFILRAPTAELEAQTIGSFQQELPSAPEKRPDVSLFIVGDVMLDRTVASRMRQAKDTLYPFRRIMTDERFTAPDLRLMNLEGPVTPTRRPPEKEIDFAFDPGVIPSLNFAGWNGASQANNHALDQGHVGAEDSRARLTAARIIVFGHETRDDQIALATTTVRGRRLAFVGFNETSDRVDEAAAALTMAAARNAADTLIVFMHWGEEYRDRPTKLQESRAEWLIDHGADAVIGGHPHWVQGLATYRGKPIVYSLGNFVFDQDWSAETKQGMAVALLVSPRETVIEFHPVQIDRSQPRLLDGVEREERLKELAAISDPAFAAQIQQGRVSFLQSVSD